MKCTRCISVFLALTLILCAQTAAQTTRPAPANFSQLTQSIADSLIIGDPTVLSDALFSDSVIHSFESDSESNSEKLAAAFNGASIITARAYAQNPSTLAADLATDFKQAADLPDSVRREMVPDPGTMIRANVTANQWIDQILKPTRGQSIGVIVLFPAPPPTSGALRPTPRRPIFILLKGAAQNHKPKIQHIIFGDPLTAPR